MDPMKTDPMDDFVMPQMPIMDMPGDMGMPGAEGITAAELDYYQRLYESMYGPPPGMIGGGYGPGGLPSVSQLMHMAMTTPLFPFGKTIKKRRPCVRRKPRRPNAQEGSLYYNKKNRLYEVRICNQGKQIYLGQFETEESAERTLKEARAAKIKGKLLEYKTKLKQRKHLLSSGRDQKRNARGHFIRQRTAKPPAYLADLPLRTSRGNPREADIEEMLVRKAVEEGMIDKRTGRPTVKLDTKTAKALLNLGNISPMANMLVAPKGIPPTIDLESPASLRPVCIKEEE